MLIGFVVQSNAQDTKSIKSEVPTAISKYYFVSENQIHLSIGVSDETNNAIMFQKDDQDARDFLTASLKLVMDSIDSNSEVELLPSETLKGKVVYSRMGFPLASLKKAAKKANHEQYVSVEIAVLASKTISTSQSENYTDAQINAALPVEVEVEGAEIEVKETLATSEFYPQVQVTLKFGDSSGKTLAKLKGIYTHNERVSITTQSTDAALVGDGGSFGFSNINDQDADQIPYFVFLARAVNDLVRQLP